MSSLSGPRSGAKRATNVSLTENLLSKAKALHINISHAAEAGLAQAIAHRQTELWLEQNKEAIDAQPLV